MVKAFVTFCLYYYKFVGFCVDFFPRIYNLNWTLQQERSLNDRWQGRYLRDVLQVTEILFIICRLTAMFFLLGN